MEQAQLQEREPLRAQSRDRELVRLIGRHGAMTIEQVMKAMRCGRTASYRRVARCVEGGLIERLAIPGVFSAVLIATRAGLSYAGLGLPVAKVSPATVTHTLRCASLAIPTEREQRVLTEREIVLSEQLEGRRIASVRVGSVHGKPRYHRADLAILTEEGTIAAEVELTPKAPARLQKIIAAWYRAPYIHRVEYLCVPGQTHRAVQRTVKKLRAQEKILVRELSR